ncbi:glutamate racemase [Candidatus Falkowbacteria bacterium]|nr:MAG: glutamate racemase [Candidatus Falkowbacteria bacterium]
MIGVFDSGFGGLTVFKELIKVLPEYNYIYLGDNARAPYGNKSEDLIYEYTRSGVDFLFKKGCQLIIIACNTASAKALRKIQQEYLPENYPNRKVLGVIIPAAETVWELIKEENKQSQPIKIGIIGTKATIKSKVYEKELRKKTDNLEIFSKSCPLLVPLVEEGWTGKRETKMIFKKYLRPLKEKKIKYLILGCTHYPFLLKQIKQIMGKTLIINTPEAVAIKTAEYLDKHKNLEKKLIKNKKQLFLTTDSPKEFKNFCLKLFKNKIDIEKIVLK